MVSRPCVRDFCIKVVLAFACVYSFLPVYAQTPESVPLTMGKSVERELKGDAAHSYTIELQAGRFLSLLVEQKGIDVVVTLFDPAGKNVSEVDSPNGDTGPEPVIYITELTGTYRLEVHSLEKEAPVGRYEAKIIDVHLATANDRIVVKARKLVADAETLRNEATAASFSDALAKLKDALPLFQSIRDKQGEATSLYHLGRIFSDLGDHEKGLDHMLRSLGPYREAGDKWSEAVAMNDIGETYAAMNEYQKALEYLNHALLVHRAAGDKREEATALANIGSIYHFLGDHRKAIEYYNSVLPIFRLINAVKDEAGTYINIGAAYADLEEYDKALDNYSKALPLVRRAHDANGEAYAISNMGTVFHRRNDYQKALEHYGQSLRIRRSIGDKTGEADDLQKMAAAYSDSGDTNKGLDSYEQILPLWRLLGDKDGEARLLGELAFHWHSAGNNRLSVFYCKLSLDAFQSIRSKVASLDKATQQGYLKSIEHHYRFLANILLIQNRLAEAQEVLNLFKDQQHFDLNANRQLKPLSLTQREQAREELINQKLDAVVGTVRLKDELLQSIGSKAATQEEGRQLKDLEARLALATAEYHESIKAIETEFAAKPDVRDNPPDINDLRTMQDALRETSATTKRNAVAVYTLVFDEAYLALVITPTDSFTVSTPIKNDELNRKALQLWTLLRTPKYDPRPAANELYKTVFAPIEKRLPAGTKTILWSLDASLRYIPMAALYDGRQYLAERYENVIFTRADKERMIRPQSKEKSGSGFGSSEALTVELLGSKLNAVALPSVRTELARIFKMGRQGIIPGKVLLDRQFTKSAMIEALESHLPIVHIASHFKFEPGDESRSFLLMGDGTPFTLEEMKTKTNLFNGVDLLTLSACETAAQKPDANGREVDGFAELAQRLGAGAVMASLWEVSDDSTAELMTRFYSGYRSTSAFTKAEALRHAQLALLKGKYSELGAVQRQLELVKEKNDLQASAAKPFRRSRSAPFAHPYYWSPFILIGNWK